MTNALHCSKSFSRGGSRIRMNEFTVVFLAAVAVASVIELWLAGRQISSVSRHRGAVPYPFQESISLSTHKKAADYTCAKLRLERVEIVAGALLVIGWTLGGGVETLAGLWNIGNQESIGRGTGFLLSALLMMSVLNLPLAVYRTFVVEARFGFSRVTPALYLSDLVKHALLAAALGAPLIALLLWLLAHTGAWWWLWGWAAWMGFALLMLWAYPSVIAPLFNRFTPLQDSALQQRIENLLQRCGFASGGVFVMDGSKRSQHGNAYFTGLGNQKRIVFFDTLLRSLAPDEIEAVLAHELGHFKHGHVNKRLIFMAVTTFAGFAVLGWLSGQTWFYAGLGVSAVSHAALLLLFLLVSPYFTALLHPFSAYWMRKHEFEADAYAAQQADAQKLIDALVKLYQENAATLTPDPLYSAYHDSHPPAPVRIAQLAGTRA